MKHLSKHDHVSRRNASNAGVLTRVGSSTRSWPFRARPDAGAAPERPVSPDALQESDLSDDSKAEDDSSRVTQSPLPSSHPIVGSQPKAVTASFTSSGARRTLKDGVETVPASDSEASDSDSSLEELSDILLRNSKRATRSAAIVSSDSKPPKSASAMPSFVGPPLRKKVRIDTVPPPPRPPSKFSFDSLLNTLEKDATAEKRRAESSALLEKLSSDDEPGVNSGSEGVDDGTLATVLGSDGDDSAAQRVLQAIRRTEVRHKAAVWHFFKDIPPVVTQSPFPATTAPVFLKHLMNGDLRQLASPSLFLN
jgi:hypothetical protein